MQKEINLKEILKAYVSSEIIEEDYGIEILESCRVDEIVNAMKEACRQTLKLAAENAKIKFVDDDHDLLDGGYHTIDKQSILNTISQIK